MPLASRLQAEKRKHPRLAVRIPAIYRSANVTLDAHVSNISQSGLFISCSSLDVVGTTGEILVSLPGQSTSVHLSGRVIWSSELPQLGMGFAFVNLTREYRLALANFLIARFCAA
jgi:uncharacterized protein (TIGR02266 family)